MLPGKYSVSINISNSDNSLIGYLSTKIEVKKMNESFLHTSDIEFVFKTEELTENSVFSKGELNVLPNVWRRYGALNPKLTFYYEVYEIDTSYVEPLIIDYRISTNENKVVKRIGGINLQRGNKQRSVIHAINVTNLSSSVYNLEITITDPITDRIAEVSRKLEVIQFDRFYAQSNLTIEDIQLFDQLFSYIANDAEYELYKSLNDANKGKFIVNFWKSKDPNPSTPENEYLISILEKFNYTNQNFSWGSEPGWKSD